MSETKFTPGPWEVGRDGHGADCWVYCDDVTGSAVANCNTGGGMIRREQQTANAALIAAAPDQNAALLQCVDRFERITAWLEKNHPVAGFPAFDAAEDMARAALRKAADYGADGSPQAAAPVGDAP